MPIRTVATTTRESPTWRQWREGLGAGDKGGPRSEDGKKHRRQLLLRVLDGEKLLGVLVERLSQDLSLLARRQCGDQSHTFSSRG